MRLKCSETKHVFPLFTTATVVYLPYNQAIRTRVSDVTVFVLWKPHVYPLVFLISLWMEARQQQQHKVSFARVPISFSLTGREGKSSKNLVIKMELATMMHESVWFEKPQFEQDETNYQLHLARNNPKVSFASILCINK